MKHKYLILCAGVAVLSACTENGAIEEAVKARLKDPDSAKFGEISIIEGKTGKHACATVNARNAMGGYNGDAQMFLSYDETDGWIAVDSLDDYYSHEKCKELAETMANKKETE